MMPAKIDGADQNPALHPWIVADPQLAATRTSRKAFCYELLSKITLLAVAAICVAVLVVYFAVGSATAALPLFLAALVLTTPFLAVGSFKLQALGKEFREEANLAHLVVERYKLIKDWQEKEIREFFEKNRIGLPSAEFLKLFPLRSLLPLIARFEARRIQAEVVARDAALMIRSEDLAADDKAADRLQSRLIGFQLLEDQVAPAILESGLILQILSQPTMQLRTGDIGSILKKPPVQRLFDRLHGPDDNYFVFDEKGRKALTLQELIDNHLTPRAIRDKLFPIALQQLRS